MNTSSKEIAKNLDFSLFTLHIYVTRFAKLANYFKMRFFHKVAVITTDSDQFYFFNVEYGSPPLSPHSGQILQCTSA